MVPRLFMKVIAEILVRVAESNKPVFTLLFAGVGALAASILALSGARNVHGALVSVAAFGGLGAAIDFWIGKSGQARAKSALETIALKALFYTSDKSSHKRPSGAKVHRISLVERVSRNSIWSQITRAVTLAAIAIYVAAFTESAQLYIGLLAGLAVLSALDAGIVWWRAAKGEYGLSKLEVKEIGRLIAAARRRRDNGGDPGTFVAIFPDEEVVSSDWVWHPEGVRS
jgi:hypothetical protein